ncbi:hypothetical protein PspKH34_29010 [Parageobacillus sp. KH3-4]|nr:hypothetical protein PspKH34_29010 [Parageobacillus sp. KH3-4]
MMASNTNLPKGLEVICQEAKDQFRIQKEHDRLKDEYAKKTGYSAIKNILQ